MSVQQSAASFLRWRRVSLLLESFPFAIGVGLLVWFLLTFLIFVLPGTTDGQTWFGHWSEDGPPSLVLPVSAVLGLVTLLFGFAFLGFFLSGIG
jgi:hypothetical protein